MKNLSICSPEFDLIKLVLICKKNYLSIKSTIYISRRSKALKYKEVKYSQTLILTKTHSFKHTQKQIYANENITSRHRSNKVINTVGLD